MTSITRTLSLLRCPASFRPLIVARLYATQTGLGTTGTSPQQRRKGITPFNDDGRIPWGQLSSSEKVARTTQQSFNFGLIVIGAVLTGGVAYIMWTEVFSPDSTAWHFSSAVNRVRSEPRCTELLGDSKKISAYGEGTLRGWKRARPIASSVRKDQRDVEHMTMHFNVEGPLAKGVVSLHMIKRPEDTEYIYKYLALDVKGHQRIYLENADASPDSPAKNKSKMFGISWR